MVQCTASACGGSLYVLSSGIVHPGITFHFDLLFKKHCELTLCHKGFKLSMETLLNFDLAFFVKITKILTSPRVNTFLSV